MINIPWWLGTLFGSVFLTIVVYIQRSYAFSIYVYLGIAFLNTISTLGFWYGFRSSTSFMFCWFLGFVFNVFAATILSSIFFNEPLTIKNIIGMIVIILGIIILKF